jgi:hypothetical protein
MIFEVPNYVAESFPSVDYVSSSHYVLYDDPFGVLGFFLGV